ncbi:MAG: hypothetical protein HYT90_02080 [Candidatus Omnitrophica bacterium]|nr:hypothetical protein [Candidatus Omnitrophota bacterium]
MPAIRRSGLTLVELLVGAVVLAVAVTALLGAFLGQLTMNEHARRLAWAANDASRVMEQVRRQNSGGACAAPSANPPAGFGSWDAWLADASASGGGGKSIEPAGDELVVVTPAGANPLTVTVAVCWRHRARILGECTGAGALAPSPGAGGNPLVTESPAMLATLVTCRR